MPSDNTQDAEETDDVSADIRRAAELGWLGMLWLMLFEFKD
jgi:hypothetical protein